MHVGTEARLEDLAVLVGLEDLLSKFRLSILVVTTPPAVFMWPFSSPQNPYRDAGLAEDGEWTISINSDVG